MRQGVAMEQVFSEVALSGGRVVEISTAGDPRGRTVVYHHGTPTGRSIPTDFLEAAAPRGIRLIGYNRPGYAGSTANPGRSVADDAALLAELLDFLEVDDFVSVGWSGGGPHALAAAALLPGRCRAATVIAGVAPFQAAGLDWFAGMGEDNLAEFGAAVAGEESLRAFLTEAAQGLREVTGDDIIGALASLLPDADRRVLTGNYADEMAADMRDAVSRGIDGWCDDDLAFARPWGFALDSIATPLALWQGSDDLMVPLAHGRWLAAAIPQARARELSGEGHLSLVHNRMGELFDELVGLAGW